MNTDGSRHVKVIVVDDHVAVREGVKTILSEDPTIDVIGEGSNGEAAVSLVDKRRPDVVVMDVRMDGMDGFEATRVIGEQHPEVAVMLLTGTNEKGSLGEGVDCGARGYLLKTAPPADIVRAVHMVADGGAFVDPELAGELLTPYATGKLPALTKREAEILGLLANGRNNEQVASDLFISQETVRTHVRNAMDKLDANHRTQAVAEAIRRNLITV